MVAFEVGKRYDITRNVGGTIFKSTAEVLAVNGPLITVTNPAHGTEIINTNAKEFVGALPSKNQTGPMPTSGSIIAKPGPIAKRVVKPKRR